MLRTRMAQNLPRSLLLSIFFITTIAERICEPASSTCTKRDQG